MGAAGWEMVGGATLPITKLDKKGFVTENSYSLYFKRRKQ
jgi:hypothetical protein